jgi:hypothetical protein
MINFKFYMKVALYSPKAHKMLEDYLEKYDDKRRLNHYVWELAEMAEANFIVHKKTKSRVGMIDEKLIFTAEITQTEGARTIEIYHTSQDELQNPCVYIRE